MSSGTSPRSAERLIEAVGARLQGTPLAVMLDIDGTLAPIASQPSAAVVPSETRTALRRLAELPGVYVALISGRSVADAVRMIPVRAAWIIGNHGLEVRPAHGDVQPVDAVRPYASAISKAVNALTPRAREVRGTVLEDKRWTLSLHFRLVDPAAVPGLLAHARDVASRLGLRVTEGKKVIELRPPIDVDKGTAALDFASWAGALDHGASMLYAGDDRTDEDAFRALRTHGNAVTVRVLEEAADDSAPVETNAEVLLESPDEVRRVLVWLADRRARY